VSCRWAQRESNLQEMDGFRAFVMARRDDGKADDEFNYQSTTIWSCRAAFEAWTQSQQFAKSHQGSGKVRSVVGASTFLPTSLPVGAERLINQN
jgi:heme-degrading monooxygenase HmoA